MRWKIKKQKNKNLINHLLEIRDIKNKEEFINPAHPSTLSPQAIGVKKKDLQKAIHRILKAVKKKEKIIVYGDYDVDGVSATAVMWETLHELGAEVLPFIPNREEGYGFSPPAVKRLMKKHQPQLIITVDHGITALNKVEKLSKQGVDIIITDHHQPPSLKEIKKLNKVSQAVLHTDQLSGAGISWYLAQHLAEKENKEHLGLAALGTIADIVPLVEANRSIVKHGLKLLSKTEKVGLKALKKEAGIENTPLQTYHVGYVLGPRINAAGRLEQAVDALRLICTNDKKAAPFLARRLSKTNQKRQNILREQFNFILNQLKQVKSQLPPILIVGDESLEEGIIGLLASKLSAKFYRPAIVLSKKEEISKASARSIPGVDIISLIRKVDNLLLGCGGHPMAAGFTLQTENISQVAEELIQEASSFIDEEKFVRSLSIDAEISLREADRDLYEKIEAFAPFGAGNPRPLFAARRVFLSDVKTVGKNDKHLKFKADGREAIAFNRGFLKEKIDPAEAVDLAFSLDLNRWNNREILQLKIKDIKQE